MAKLIFVFISTVCFLACTNTSNTASNKDSSATTASSTGKPKFTAEELEFLGPCYDEAKARLGEQRAYSLCHCLYHEVQQKYPGADSATLVKHLSDTAEVRQMTMNCQ